MGIAMVDAAVVVVAAAAVAAAVEEAPLPARVSEPVQYVELVPKEPPLVLLPVLLHFGFVGLLVDVAVSKLAFAFASRDFDEWLLLPGHILGIGRPYTYGSDSVHTVNSHNEVQDIFGLYIPQYVSTNASCPHSVVSRDIVRRRADI